MYTKKQNKAKQNKQTSPQNKCTPPCASEHERARRIVGSKRWFTLARRSPHPTVVYTNNTHLITEHHRGRTHGARAWRRTWQAGTWTLILPTNRVVNVGSFAWLCGCVWVCSCVCTYILLFVCLFLCVFEYLCLYVVWLFVRAVCLLCVICYVFVCVFVCTCIVIAYWFDCFPVELMSAWYR